MTCTSQSTNNCDWHDCGRSHTYCDYASCKHTQQYRSHNEHEQEWEIRSQVLVSCLICVCCGRLPLIIFKEVTSFLIDFFSYWIANDNAKFLASTRRMCFHLLEQVKGWNTDYIYPIPPPHSFQPALHLLWARPCFHLVALHLLCRRIRENVAKNTVMRSERVKMNRV